MEYQWIKKLYFKPDFFLIIILGMARQIIKCSHVHFQHGIVLTTQSFENQNITETVYQILLNEKSNDSLRPFVTDQPSP